MRFSRVRFTIHAIESIRLKSRGGAGSDRLLQNLPMEAHTSWASRACAGVAAVLLCGCAGMILIDLHHASQAQRALAEIQRAGGIYIRQERGHSHPVIAIDLDARVVYDSGEAPCGVP